MKVRIKIEGKRNVRESQETKACNFFKAKKTETKKFWPVFKGTKINKAQIY